MPSKKTQTFSWVEKLVIIFNQENSEPFLHLNFFNNKYVEPKHIYLRNNNYNETKNIWFMHRLYALNKLLKIQRVEWI